ncbi:hypothetical protein QBC34DRAFT_156975 [Podospora aff. communis PSN243]|uniref:Uncharacterized protein n=1 Tax=Podospora aff. communis PSN243 TaxID=3040156 RepID=A0AAV9H0T4_9PEZI|nr:hypothetical protein QBC34DRAFT_156975 [Podospora aff. communis PSN243]
MISTRLFIAAALACNFLLAMAAPAVLDDRCPKAKVIICDNTHFRGDCKTVEVELDTCAKVEKEWNDRISSIENTSRAAFRCVWYINNKCEGDGYANQKDDDLGDGNGAFSESISAYRCSPNE